MAKLSLKHIFKIQIFTKHCIKLFYQKQKLIAAICAAPLILDAVGILKGKEYVCFPSCETNIDGIYKENERVVVKYINNYVIWERV